MTQYDLLNALLHFLFFFMGTGIGSFLNVVIYRLPLGMSVNKPRRSFCPICKNQLSLWQNLPIVSWLCLRGKCGHCGAPIPFRYIAVEIVTAALFVLGSGLLGGAILGVSGAVAVWRRGRRAPDVVCRAGIARTDS
jgi:leader peptidase (prepilin peptidase)/N-methyltransferase